MARFVHRVHMRWSDMDAYRHINNSAYLAYLEQARVAMFFDRHDGILRAARDRPPRDRLSAAGRLPPGAAAAGIVGRRGPRRLVHRHYEVFDGDVLAARAATICVPFNFEHRSARRLTDEERACSPASPTTVRDATPRRIRRRRRCAIACRADRTRSRACGGRRARPATAWPGCAFADAGGDRASSACRSRCWWRAPIRRSGADDADLDITVGCGASCWRWLDGDARRAAARARRGVAQRPAAASGWRRLDTVPDDVVRDLVRQVRPRLQGGRPRTRASERPAPSRGRRRVARLGRAHGDRRDEPRPRSPFGRSARCLRMGFLPRDSHVAVDDRGALDPRRRRVRLRLCRAPGHRPQPA